tara:strand:- start:11388 stop:12737 length:1350 start_codon:yes stop_codon:yes gene_type:complete
MPSFKKSKLKSILKSKNVLPASRPENQTIGNTGILRVIRKTFDYIAQNPNKLNEEGVLRISGEKTRVDALISKLASDQPVVSEDYSIHDFVVAFKRSLTDKALKDEKLEYLSSSDYQDLHEVINTNKGEPNYLKNCATALQRFISTLARSNDPKKVEAAEIIYSFIHLGQKVSNHQASNKMGPSQCATCIGPALQHALNFGSSSNPSEAIESQKIINTIVEMAIGESYYNEKFDVKFSSSIIKLKEAEINIINENLKELDQKAQDLNSQINLFDEGASSLKSQVKEQQKIVSDSSSSQPAVKAAAAHRDRLLIRVDIQTNNKRKAQSQLAPIQAEIKELQQQKSSLELALSTLPRPSLSSHRKASLSIEKDGASQRNENIENKPPQNNAPRKTAVQFSSHRNQTEPKKPIRPVPPSVKKEAGQKRESSDLPSNDNNRMSSEAKKRKSTK